MHIPEGEACMGGGDCGSCPSHQEGHAHEAQHRMPEPQTPRQMAAVLQAMLRQLKQQSAWLDRYTSALMDMDREESAMQLQKAADEYSKGSLYLGLALHLLEEE